MDARHKAGHDARLFVIAGLIRQPMPTIGSAWTTDIGVQRTPFCERPCPVVTIGKKSHREIIVLARPAA